MFGTSLLPSFYTYLFFYRDLFQYDGNVLLKLKFVPFFFSLFNAFFQANSQLSIFVTSVLPICKASYNIFSCKFYRLVILK